MDELDEDDEPCACGAADCAVAREIFDRAMTKLPEKVELFYLNQGDKLMDKQVKEIFEGDYDKVSEHLDDWFRDNDHWAIDYEIEQILSSDEIDILRVHPPADTYHSTLHDELCDAIRERDESDPMGELIRGTPDVMLCLDARMVIDSGEPRGEVVDTLCRELRLSPATNGPRICDWLADNHDEVWGEVNIVWRADVKEAVDQFKPWDDEAHGNVAVFTDPWISVEGAMLELKGEAVVPLTKVNLLPNVDTNISCDREFAASPKVMTEFDRYREELVDFINYRNRILEGST